MAEKLQISVDLDKLVFNEDGSITYPYSLEEIEYMINTLNANKQLNNDKIEKWSPKLNALIDENTNIDTTLVNLENIRTEMEGQNNSV